MAPQSTGNTRKSTATGRMGFSRSTAFSYLPKLYELEKLIEVLKEAYQARLEKKFVSDQAKLAEIIAMAEGESPLGILRKLRELDDHRK